MRRLNSLHGLRGIERDRSGHGGVARDRLDVVVLQPSMKTSPGVPSSKNPTVTTNG
jgi:hypothetical protein